MVPVLIIITDASAPSPASPCAWEEVLNYIFSQDSAAFSILKTCFRWDISIEDINVHQDYTLQLFGIYNT